MSTETINKLYRLQQLLLRYQMINRMPGAVFGNPLRGQGRILSLLKIKESISQKELAYLLDMRQQSLSELLSKLEAKGLISRDQSDEDRRISIIRITEEGRGAATEAEADQDLFSGVFACLDDGEIAQLDKFLDRITEALEKNLTERGEDGIPFGKRIRPRYGMFNKVQDNLRCRHERFRNELHDRADNVGDGHGHGHSHGHGKENNRDCGKGRRCCDNGTAEPNDVSDSE